MLIGSLVKYTLVVSVVLILASPTEAYFIDFFFGGLRDRFVKAGQSIVKTVGDVTIGGGTAIVTDAIKLNYFGIGPRIQKWFGIAIEKGGGALLSGSWYLFTKTISKIFDLFTSVIKEISKSLWKLKGDIVWWAVKLILPVINADDFAFDIDFQKFKNKSKIKRSVGPMVQVLRGRREVGWHYDDTLENTFTSATMHDRMQCLPLVLCAIYADPDHLAFPIESKFKKAFRSFFSEEYTPVWATKYVEAADVGESSKSAASCQAAYPSCTFSPRHLRQLISQAMNVYWHKENINEVKT